MKTIEITCTTCGKKSQKRKAEIDRRTRIGKTKFYCDMVCAGKEKSRHAHLLLLDTDYDISQHCDNRRDEFSDFKWYMKNTRKNKRHNHNVTLEYLKELWESQQGKCPLTGWLLRLKTHTNPSDRTNKYQASLDRIDSSKGYIKGNVRFIAVIANYAKNLFTDDDVIEFCEAVVKHKHKD